MINETATSNGIVQVPPTYTGTRKKNAPMRVVRTNFAIDPERFAEAVFSVMNPPCSSFGGEPSEFRRSLFEVFQARLGPGGRGVGHCFEEDAGEDHRRRL